MLFRMFGKVTPVVYDKSDNDSEIRSKLVDYAGEVCKKALNPTDSIEFKALKLEFEHQQRQYRRLLKRTQKTMAEVERNRLRLEDHLIQLKINEKSETEKIVNQIKQMTQNSVKCMKRTTNISRMSRLQNTSDLTDQILPDQNTEMTLSSDEMSEPI